MTNAYAASLAKLQKKKQHDLKEVGDQWQTPPEIAHGLFEHFKPQLGPVVLDIFADDCNALLPNYYTAKQNALVQNLASDLHRLGGAGYGNPPYSIPQFDKKGNAITGMEHILTWCRFQREAGAKIMLLVKSATSEGWWPEDADFIQFIAGRITFKTPNWYRPTDPKKKAISSGFASAVIIFDKQWKGESRPAARLKRDELAKLGQQVLQQHNQASAAA